MVSGTARPWWQQAVFYQIYPRSFCDTSGNGVGDLNGIRQHLDHLVWLGIDCLWLSPIFRSPMADHGYDVSDYTDVDPLFGSLDDLDALVAETHSRGLRLLLDWVPCHSSDQHPWFLMSRSSRDNPKRDWYVWRDGSPDRPPTKWHATFPPGVPAWTWDETTEAWYYHRFAPQQPDLNWANPEVRSAMYDTLRFWLDRGIDGFRIDVVHNLGKDLSLIDAGGGGLEGVTDHVATHAHLREIRKLVASYPGDRIAVGETFVLDVEQAASYVGHGTDGEELHLGFNFMPLFLPWEAWQWRKHIAEADQAYAARDAWSTWAFSNHDNPRVATRLGTAPRARAVAVLLLGVRGTPFLYAGEELGLKDADVPPEMAEDPAGFRDGCRAPVPWDQWPNHGWATDDTWLPFPPQADSLNAVSQQADPGSTLHLYRRLLAARRGSPALQYGEQVVRGGGKRDDVVVLERHDPASGDQRVVAVNFSAEEQNLALTGELATRSWVIEVSSDGEGESQTFGGRLAPDQAVILKPA